MFADSELNFAAIPFALVAELFPGQNFKYPTDVSHTVAQLGIRGTGVANFVNVPSRNVFEPLQIP